MDVVYLYKFPSQGVSNELRWSLRSLRNLAHDKVFFIGDKPNWVTGVTHIPYEHRTDIRKWQRTSDMIDIACHDDRISDPFILMHDDYYIMKKMDSVGVYNVGPLDELYDRAVAKLGESRYIRGMLDTLAFLHAIGIENPIAYELHQPLIIHKDKMIEALGYCYGICDSHKQTVYGNLAQLGGETVSDVKWYSYAKPADTTRFMSTDNRSYALAMYDLETRIGPGRSQYETFGKH